MLSSLHIENIAIIRRQDIDFPSGFCVLTGETGAGKSILIDSINLLLGGRFSRDMIRTGEDSATVGGTFTELSGETCVAMAELGFEDTEFYIQRTVHADGKSVTKCNGRTIPQSMQRTIVGHLIHIHGQHDNTQLLNEANHILFLDEYAKLSAQLAEYEAAFREMRTAEEKLRSFRKGEEEKARMAELLSYQLRDIDGVSPRPGEEDELLQSRNKLRNLEKVTKQARLIYRALYSNEKGLSASELIGKAADAFLQLADIMPEAAALSDRLNSCRYELIDAAETVHDFTSSDDAEDPTKKLDRIEERLSALTKLKRKYGSTVEEVLAFREKTRAELDEIELSDVYEKKYTAEYLRFYEKAAALATALSERRKEAAIALQEALHREFSYLDMEKVSISVSVTEKKSDDGKTVLSKTGADTVCFMIATNPGEPYKPLAKIASGGELSRIMLAAKCVLRGQDRDATLIFDEIDTGVSGKTSHKIGTKMRSLAHGDANGQVLCVTHSAQVAAQADAHFLIEKTEKDGHVYTGVTLLDDDGRVEEIARITAGIHITETARAGARELLRGGQ